ncbi:EpsG family protein [Altererythrobacter sp.]|nr:EpsG family protein [Altererythrobacter sp.]
MIAQTFMLFGTISVFGLVANAIRDARVERLLFVAVGVLLVLFAGLREVGVDQDSFGYLRYYNLDDFNMGRVAEPTFVLIANITRSISSQDGLSYLFFIYALAGVTLKLLAIRRLTELYWLALLTYFSWYFLLHEFTQIRAAIASGLVLLSLPFVLQRRLFPFVLTITIASLFHFSALLAFALYLLRNRRLEYWEKVLIAASVPLGSLLHFFGVNLFIILPIELVQLKVETYTEAEAARNIKLNVFNAVYLIKYSLLYVFLLFSTKLQEESEYFPIILKMYAIAMFSYLALSFNSAFAIRISELFGVVEILLIPMFYYLIKPRSFAIVLIVLIAIGNLSLGLFETELIQESPF